jgi:hypothetical protein
MPKVLISFDYKCQNDSTLKIEELNLTYNLQTTG